MRFITAVSWALRATILGGHYCLYSSFISLCCHLVVVCLFVVISVIILIPLSFLLHVFVNIDTFNYHSIMTCYCISNVSVLSGFVLHVLLCSDCVCFCAPNIVCSLY